MEGNNTIGGHPENAVGLDVIGLPFVGATIAGGGGTIGTLSSRALYTNTVAGPFGTIGGGAGNSAYTLSTVAGGWQNVIAGNSSAIAGGQRNSIAGSWATIAGGKQNTNTADFTTISGGELNVANGSYATIPGGINNSATTRAFAAGTRAKANHTGSFVWADSTDADFTSSANNQLLIRASGGVGIGTNAPVSALHVNGTVTANGVSSPNTLAFATGGSERLRIATNGNVGIGTDNPKATLELALTNGQSMQFRYDNNIVPGINMATTGVNAGVLRLRNNLQVWPSDDGLRSGRIDVRNPAGTAVIILDGDVGRVTCVSLNQTSDRNAKENFAGVDGREVLEKVVNLPISSWNFKQEKSTRHIGPMAQDFHAAFDVGPDEKHIAAVDADGVALAAIQGLNKKVDEKEEEIQLLKNENTSLKQRMEALEKLVTTFINNQEASVASAALNQ